MIQPPIQIAEIVQTTCWVKPDFWIFLVLAVISLGVSGFGWYFSWLAYHERMSL